MVASRGPGRERAPALLSAEGSSGSKESLSPVADPFISDYLAMCRDGEVEFSSSEAARLMGVSTPHLYRCMSRPALGGVCRTTSGV